MPALPILPESENQGPNGLPPARPPWLRVRAPSGERYESLRALLTERRLHTVCASAACPNMGECWNAGTATFMILGNECTRACRFCDVKTTQRPPPPDPDEATRLAEAASLMGLSHVVITSVARDDLPDGGAAHFARCLHAVRARLPAANLEVLVPDFAGQRTSIAIVLDAGPAIFNHNLETVARLTKKIRSGAEYQRSLEVLRTAKALAPHVMVKSGLMLGLGETPGEIETAMRDLKGADVDILTVGQYLRPSSWHLPVDRYAPLEEFSRYADLGRQLGFSHVESGPLVRSSYHAERALR